MMKSRNPCSTGIHFFEIPAEDLLMVSLITLGPAKPMGAPGSLADHIAQHSERNCVPQMLDLCKVIYKELLLHWASWACRMFCKLHQGRKRSIILAPPLCWWSWKVSGAQCNSRMHGRSFTHYATKASADEFKTIQATTRSLPFTLPWATVMESWISVFA